MLRRWFFRRSQPSLPVRHTILAEYDTNILLTSSKHVAPIAFLNESIDNTRFVVAMLPPSDPSTTFDELQRTGTFPHWRWNKATRRLVPTQTEFLSDAVRERSKLISAQAYFITWMMHHLNTVRQSSHSGVLLQDTVYRTKRDQAENFKSAGYDESRIVEYPFILQYADLKQISPRDAADDILFKAKMHDDFLARTELLRLKHFNAIRNAKQSEELRPIYEKFFRECYRATIV